MANQWVSLSIKHVDWSGIRDLPRKYRGIVKEAMLATGEYWHENILPRHFSPAAHGRYNYEQRASKYLKRKQLVGIGDGKSVYLVLTGMSRRFLMFLYKVSGTSRSFRVRMQAPVYFTSPFVGGIPMPHGGTMNVRHQPDKPGETSRVSVGDARELQEFTSKRVQELIAKMPKTKVVTTSAA